MQNLSPEEEANYMELLMEYRDIFAWSYDEMPGFIREVKYPTWISNIVPVKKKNGQMRVFVWIFEILNNACPKDDFPLPITEIMVDATTGHGRLNLHGRFNLAIIKFEWHPHDEEKTAFRTPKGIYCYKVMPFGLKNAGKESALYYLSRTLNGAELNYSPIEKTMSSIDVCNKEVKALPPSAFRPLPKAPRGVFTYWLQTDYFSKWAEAVALREVKKETVYDALIIHVKRKHVLLNGIGPMGSMDLRLAPIPTIINAILKDTLIVAWPLAQNKWDGFNPQKRVQHDQSLREVVAVAECWVKTANRTPSFRSRFQQFLLQYVEKWSSSHQELGLDQFLRLAGIGQILYQANDRKY
ncbi:hypothetical protein D5086_014043 [Populus alba]|uniref:Uncharacterized protein n=1 Tax=Populus alba TaxID=43335 RepID=A0ACC4C719_POPAL